MDRGSSYLLSSKICLLVRWHTKKQAKSICIVNFINFVFKFVISAVLELSSPETFVKETLYLFSQRSSQPSGGWNPLILMFSASFLAFVFKIDAVTTTFLPLKVRSHLKMRSSKSVYVPFLILQRFNKFSCVSLASKIFPLLLIRVDKVFFWNLRLWRCFFNFL